MRFLKNWFPSKPSRPFQLFQIEPTLLCGLSCVMCPWTELRSAGGHMSWETFSRIRRYLPQAVSVDLTGGGEPLTHPRLPEMVRAAREAGCRTGFSTNGAALTPELSHELLDAGLDWISFSVDAATADVYDRIRRGASFDQVTANIAGLRDLKQRLGRRTPVMMMVFVMMAGDHANFHQLPEYIHLAKALGVEQVIAKNLDVILKPGDDQRRVFHHTQAPDPAVQEAVRQAQRAAGQAGLHLRLYELQPQEAPVCEHNPLKSVFFNWQGDLSPCITLAYASDRIFAGEAVQVPCQRFGSINTGDFQSIWDQDAYREFRRAFERRLHWQRQAMIDSLLLGSGEGAQPMPPAPPGCRTCYYLYGI